MQADNTLLARLTSALANSRISRRDFLKDTATGLGARRDRPGQPHAQRRGQAFAYEPYPRDDELTTVVTTCAHNCGSRHMLVAHKKGDVIVRLSTDDGRYQEGGAFGKDTEEEPQLRACLRGRSYRARLYSPERLLYPMMRVGERGEGKFKRVSWDEALSFDRRARWSELKEQVRPDRAARPELCRRLLRRAAQVRPDRGPARPLPRHVRLPHQFVVGAVLSGHDVLLAHDLRHHRGRQRGRHLRPLQADHHVGLEPGLHLPRRQHLLLHAPGQAARLQVRAGRSAIHRLGRRLRRLVDPDQAEHRRRDAGRHGAPHLRQQPAGPDVHRQVLPGHGRRHDAGLGQGQGELQGLHPRQVRRPAQDARMGRADLRRQGRRHQEARRRCTPPPSRPRSRPRGRRAATPTASSTTAWPPPCRR